MTRVLIIAAGSDQRWNNHRGTAKHLAVVEKEVLLKRTVDQFLKYTNDVCVVGPDASYLIDGAQLYIVKSQNTHWRDAAKFLSSKNLWNPNGRTVLVFGDVWLTSDAVKRIVKNKDSFKWFLRKGASEITGKNRGEIFAFAFNSSQAAELSQKLLYLVSMGQGEQHAQWDFYKATVGPVVSDMFTNPHYEEIDDWTEDFDTPADFDTWEALRIESRKKKK